ncbi:hypothetical protein GMRT_13798 [Giardia muris]|uniref:Uncharacterized protein n=1 Tax=Giardia muris TaxID=5742 RepID=A0A4Z1T899_GIAMU|nr:hypothetical protein GMRT_13798 [Giardia muris]|eukprot:TNJ28731.1 hypothetical protein GMRT_13798 [Giardia muris]
MSTANTEAQNRDEISATLDTLLARCRLASSRTPLNTSLGHSSGHIRGSVTPRLTELVTHISREKVPSLQVSKSIVTDRLSALADSLLGSSLALSALGSSDPAEESLMNSNLSLHELDQVKSEQTLGTRRLNRKPKETPIGFLLRELVCVEHRKRIEPKIDWTRQYCGVFTWMRDFLGMVVLDTCGTIRCIYGKLGKTWFRLTDFDGVLDLGPDNEEVIEKEGPITVTDRTIGFVYLPRN